MARRSTLAGIVTMMAITGCGGGGDDSPSPSPSPTTSPTPSPTATPTTPASFPLTATREFGTVSATMGFSGDIAGPITLTTPALDAFANRTRVAMQPVVSTTSTAETVVREDTDEVRFTGADLRTAPATTVTAYEYFRTAPSTGAFSQLLFLNNSINGSVTADTALALSYVSYLSWYRGDSTAGAKRLTFANFGNGAATTEMPTTGTVAYTMRVAGKYVIARTSAAGTVGDLGGTITTSINYGTGAVTIDAQLTRGGVAYASLAGTGTITSATNRFTGSFVSSGAAVGTFQGVAYGPQAAELGATFVLNGIAADGGISNAVGTLVGKRS